MTHVLYMQPVVGRYAYQSLDLHDDVGKRATQALAQFTLDGIGHGSSAAFDQEGMADLTNYIVPAVKERVEFEGLSAQEIGTVGAAEVSEQVDLTCLDSVPKGR